MSDTRVTPRPWLRTVRVKPIQLIEIHATRGNTTPEKQMGAALNWVQSPNNVGGRDANGNPEWGSSFSYVIGTDGSMGTVLDDNQMPTYSAGYGGVGSTYAIDEYGISYECAQSQAQEPFTDALYARLAKEVAIKCLKYGIPPVMISVTNQRGEVPTGIVRHDRCENGIKLGKTDPGVQFNEVRFIADVKAEMEPEEDDMSKHISSPKHTGMEVGGFKWEIANQEQHKAIHALGYKDTPITDAEWDALPNFPSGGGGGGLTSEEAIEANQEAARRGTG